MTLALQVAGWTLLAVALAITGALFLGQRSFAPLSDPGARANEASLIFLMLMGIRWLAMAGAIGAVMMLAWRRDVLSGGAATGLGTAAIVLHGGLGLASLWVWNYWLSVIYEKTRTQLWWCVTGHFGLPLLVLALLAVALLWATLARPARGLPPPLPAAPAR
jgi:hypothetical protein